MTKQTTRNKGFTLVELAIALTVIGLLLGGVLKGKELIENAKVTQTIRDLNAYETAVKTFRDAYDALPGDLKDGPLRLPGCSADILCNIGVGDGNRMVAYPTAGYAILEENNVMPHMFMAGMVPTKTFSTGLGGARMNYTNNGVGFAHWMQNLRAQARHAANIDRKLDDGLPMSGSIWSTGQSINPDSGFITMDAAACYDTSSGTALYVENVKDKNRLCNMFLRMDF